VTWKFWLPAALFGFASFGGWVLGDKPAFPEWMGLSLLITLKASPLLQSDLCYVAQVWVEKQIVVLGFFNSGYFFSQFERGTRTFIWQGLSLLCLGTYKISVVVPTLNEEKYISSCLGSLEKQDFEGNFEVIVVDGGSSDSTVELAKLAADKIIIYKRRPVGDARNLGAKLAEAGTVAFIDADTIASENWLSNICKSLCHPEVVGVTGPTLPYEGSELDVLAYKVATGWLQRFSMVFGLPHVAGFNCAYRREPFLRCGGFEEGRTLSEDLALSLKMRHEGQLLFNKDMVAYTSPRRIRNYGYVRLAMFYLLNDAIFALTGKSLYYPPVR
jgi:cellulose synthase/poly-beta-1,6-N-acetylglucosamine synthase-like glycosyltransferase